MSTSRGIAKALLQQLRNRQQTQHKGFTLVELMVVVVIVGVLSAVALPNFMKQTDKAKATEAKQNIAATLKQAHAQFIEDGTTPKTTATDMNSLYGTPPNNSTLFNYTATWSTPIYTITAKGNTNDAGINNKTMKGCANFTTGKVAMQKVLDDKTAPTCT